MSLVLIGMPGCGKSTIGRQISKALGWQFVDSDVEIERQLGHSIREHFERFGEERFRDVEQEVLKGLLATANNTVLATGGGSVLRAENRMALQSSGMDIVYLRTQVEDLVRRLKHDVNRPLLQGVDPGVRLKQLFSVRDPLYRESAGHIVDTGRLTVASVVGLVLGQCGLSDVVRQTR